MSELGLPESLRWASASKEHSAAVGRITIAAAWLEHEIAGLCGVLMGTRGEVAESVTNGVTARGLCDLARRLLPTSPATADKKAPVLPLLKRCQAELEKRNLVVHGLMLSSDGPRVSVLSRRKTGLPGTDYDLEDLHLIADELEYLGAEMQEVADDLVVIVIGERVV